VRADGFETSTLDGGATAEVPAIIDWTTASFAKGEFAHYMRKEIIEQPDAVRRTLGGRLEPRFQTTHLGGVELSASELPHAKAASEFRYRDPVIDRATPSISPSASPKPANRDPNLNGTTLRRQIQKPSFVAAVQTVRCLPAIGALVGITAASSDDDNAIWFDGNILDYQPRWRQRPKDPIHHGKHPQCYAYQI
jgi:hypothetical protein